MAELSHNQLSYILEELRCHSAFDLSGGGSELLVVRASEKVYEFGEGVMSYQSAVVAGVIGPESYQNQTGSNLLFLIGQQWRPCNSSALEYD